MGYGRTGFGYVDYGPPPSPALSLAARVRRAERKVAHLEAKRTLAGQVAELEQRIAALEAGLGELT